MKSLRGIANTERVMYIYQKFQKIEKKETFIRSLLILFQLQSPCSENLWRFSLLPVIL